MVEVVTAQTRQEAQQAQRQLEQQRQRLLQQQRRLSSPTALRGLSRQGQVRRQEQINAITETSRGVSQNLEQARRLASLPTIEESGARGISEGDIKLARRLASERPTSGKSIPISAIGDKDLRKIVAQIREGKTSDQIIAEAETGSFQSFSPEARKQILESARLAEAGATLSEIRASQSFRPEIRAGATLQELRLSQSLAPQGGTQRDVREVGLIERIQTTAAERKALQSLAPKTPEELRERKLRQSVAAGITSIPRVSAKIFEKVPITTAVGLPFGTRTKTIGQVRVDAIKDLENTVENINKRYKAGFITERQALDEIRKADKRFNTLTAILDLPSNILIGAGIGAASLIPVVGQALTAGFIADTILRRKTLLKQLKDFPEASAINFLALAAGTGAITLRGKQLKVNNKSLLGEARRLLRDKRGEVDVGLGDIGAEVGEILTGRKRKKRQQQLVLEKPRLEKQEAVRQISREEALELFKKKSRSEQLEILKKSVTKEGQEVVLTPQVLEKIKRFMKQSGLEEYQIKDRILELYRQQQLKLLRLDKDQGLITDVEFKQRSGLLDRQKQQLIMRLQKQSVIRDLSKPKQISGIKPRIGIAQRQISRPQIVRPRILQRQAQLQKPRVMQGSRQSTMFRNRTVQLARQSFATRYANAQASALSQRKSQLSKTAFAQPSAQRSGLDSAFRKPQLQIPRTSLRYSSLLARSGLTTRPINGRRTGREPPRRPGKPGKPLGFPDTEGASKKRKFFTLESKPGYIPFYKRGNKFYRIGRTPVTKEQAKDQVAFVVDQSLARTGRIIKAKQMAKKPTFNAPKGYFNRAANKFRSFKIVRGNKVPLRNTFIEKKTFGLDTSNEVRRIQAARLIAQRSFGLKRIKSLIGLRSSR